MMQLSLRGLVAGAFALAALACGGDSTLAPPDGLRCTAGTLTVGDTVRGEITRDGCLLWDDWNYRLRVAESWTLRTAKDKAYVVRVRPVSVNGGPSTLDARVMVYGRTASGDAALFTGPAGFYTNPTPGAGSALETVIPSREATTLSLRVTAADTNDVGGYEITVDECPLHVVPAGSTSAGVELGASCTMYAIGGLNPSPVAFFSFDATDGIVTTLTATRSAGTASLTATARGQGFDFACWVEACVVSNTIAGSGPFNFNQTAWATGTYTVAIAQTTVGTLTATLGVSQPTVTVVDASSPQH